MKRTFSGKKHLAALLAAAMLISLLPTAALAADSAPVSEGSGPADTQAAGGSAPGQAAAGQTAAPGTNSIASAGLPFQDVTGTDWFYTAVQYVYSHQLMMGTGSSAFSPDMKTTRQQVWMILARMSGEDPDTMDAARSWAMSSGLTDGTNPTASMTREQLAATLYRYANACGYDVTGRTALTSYSDAGKVSSYAYDALSWAVNAGVISGTSTSTLSPAGTATRAQLAAMLMRFCQKYGAVSDTADASQSGSTVTGRVTEVSGNTVTLSLISGQDPGAGAGGAQGASSDRSEGSSSDTPPEKPDGETGSDTSDRGEAPSSGQADGQASQGSDPGQTGESVTITITDTSVIWKTENSTEVQASLDDITAGVTLTVTCGENSQITKILIGAGSAPGEGGGNGGGQSSSSVNYTAASEITSSASESGKTYSSSQADENALLIDTSDSVVISDPTVTKTGDSDGGDNCNFYGLNAAVLVKGGSQTTITGGSVTTDASGANGVFSCGGNSGQNGSSGDGTTLVISDTVITTSGDNSGGIMTTGGGVTKAYDLTVTTSGQSSAAIRTDRGGGTVTVNGGTYTTTGSGSPAVYSTADITVSNASLISRLSEGICIEGKNSVSLLNTDLTVSNTKCNSNARFYDTVLLYQSASGDAASGTTSFTMTGGSITSLNGHVFHVTNTTAVISLTNADIVNEDSSNILLSVCDDGWSGSSNAAVLNADDQVLNGSVLVGDNSSLTMNLSNGSCFTGCVSGSITNAKGTTVSTEVGTVSVTLDSSSTWTLTGDSYITSFAGDASNIISNGYTLYVNGTALTGTR